MHAPSRPWLLLAALLSVGPLLGCATRPPASDPEALAEYNQTNDPLEPTNRFFYRVNDALDVVVLKPVAEAYRYAVPRPVRTGIHNALANLSTPVLLANDVLQAKPRRAGDTLVRFVVNSTVGVVGIFDVASGWGYRAHDNDFGITLALWGVSDGPFLFLPVLGPSNPRDATGFGVDIALDPLTYIGQGAIVTDLKWARYGVSATDERERVLDPVDQIKKGALDPYATFRSLYRQHRDSEIAAARTDEPRTVPAWYLPGANP
ncbi:MAG: VacJ family lipoprotein [Acidisphaera sp.]|nr:VacJ family lipoprotein [Acidisphaera sp.]